MENWICFCTTTLKMHTCLFVCLIGCLPKGSKVDILSLGTFPHVSMSSRSIQLVTPQNKLCFDTKDWAELSGLDFCLLLQEPGPPCPWNQLKNWSRLKCRPTEDFFPTPLINLIPCLFIQWTSEQFYHCDLKCRHCGTYSGGLWFFINIS